MKILSVNHNPKFEYNNQPTKSGWNLLPSLVKEPIILVQGLLCRDDDQLPKSYY